VQSAITRVAFRAAIVANDALLRFGNAKPRHFSLFRTNSTCGPLLEKVFRIEP
jgi:hypothetical protein